MTAHAFADIPEAPLHEQPEFFIEPTDKDPASEIQRVAMFRQLMRMASPQTMIVGIPNAGKRGQWALNQARKEGLYAGFPDLQCMAPSRIGKPPLIAFLEWKDARSKPASHQVDCLNRLHRMGFPCGVFRQAETAVAFLRRNGFPVGGGIA
jgi:hypothetical protein